MSIKQSIASLVILLSVSFSAFSGYWNHQGTNKRFPTASAVDSYVKDTWNNTVPDGEPDYIKYYDCYFSYSGTYGVGKCKETGTSRPSNIASFYYFDSNICPDGQELIDNECQIPPPPFCERPDTIQQMDDFRQACYQMGNGFSPDVSCSDATESLEMSCNPPPEPEECTPDSSDWPACKDPEPEECTPDSPDWDPRYGTCCRPENNWCDTPEPESCVIGGPNWPACATDTDIDPPTGGDLGDPDKPSGGGTGNPDPDKPEPDVDNTSDTLAAIKSMNSDLNAQLTGINNDMNKNQAETKSALDALKASVDLNTDTVVDNANHVANAIQGQSDMLSDIGNNTNRLLTSANNQLGNGFGQLSSDLGDLQQTNQQGFDELSDKLDDLKPCVPTPENRFCESPHGVDSNFVGDVLTQADSIVSGALGSYESTVVGAANDLLEKNITAESEAHITAVSDSFLNLLPQPSECMRLSLPTLNGGNVSISCEFSHKLKMILSILIYIYTIKTLVEILLTEVTPVPSNKPGSGRYY
ncbi:chemotaxis protein [Vibrio parahaemolyticus]|uniref:chemotaxis protein n=1 Tax=Vibrio parahaemolyticus TaxID=670 RepID=UPI00084A941C|nr:chemotaxis protein [Vibrio parahaemolyticus]ODY31473.1 chemotaxis protein [Vibrio parahaemolyticus]